MIDRYKLRIKDASGAEFEAEGPAEFILTQKAAFLENLKSKKTAPESWPQNSHRIKPGPETAFWDKAIDAKEDILKLRVKSPEIGAAEAALILIAANRALNRKEDLRAIILSKALKISGYEPNRLDRLLLQELREGRITASGTKRNRTYRITHKGLEKAGAAIEKINGSDQ
jgi:hypothetical protein